MIPDDLRAFLVPVPDGLPLRVVRRHGSPLLLLPASRGAARRALELYPAQARKARLAKAVLRWTLPLGLPVVRVRLVPGSPVAHLLGSREFAVYLGNPRAEGRRFLFLADDLVVKAGTGPAARALVVAEADFLATAPRLRGVPELRARREDAAAAALATGFVAGRSPQPGESPTELLTEWIDRATPVRLGALPAWRRLEAGVALPARVARLGEREVFAPLFHGDFAPWNVKVAGGEWRVLDWERGERHGPPGWDWVHYALQPRVLVERRPASWLETWLEALAGDGEFAIYLAACGLAGCAGEVIASYLLHASALLRPTEGGPVLEELGARWVAQFQAG